MSDWYTIPELAAAKLPDMPQTIRGFRQLVERENWQTQSEKVRKLNRRGGGWQYHAALLPQAAQARLQIIKQSEEKDETTVADQTISDQLWKRYNALSNAHKEHCEKRLRAVELIYDFAATPETTLNAAVNLVSAREGVSTRTLYRWLSRVNGYDRADWLAILAPDAEYMGTSERHHCHEQAWDYIKSDYLRPEKPAFSACYRRLMKVAKQHGWEPVPSEVSLRRRLNAEVSKAVQVLARDGKDKAKTLFPAQRRIRTHLHAMEAVNMDGHKLDVFVKVPGITKPVRMMLLGIQDLYSGKLVAWRLSETENKETVRLVIGDMVEQWGIPDRITLDNGRAFASKWISGGSETRYRFKVKDEDPKGLLTTLGVALDWTQPYSGQSKPIERTWRDLAENISKHPFCSGAYTGNKPDAQPENYMTRAIPLEDFRKHVAAQIIEHNAQVGRTAQNCNGRSFDETFTASLAEPSTIVRYATASQRALWLLASEAIRAQKGTGEIHYHGNRYWSRELNQYAGKRVTIRFDPDKLHEPVKVYDLDNRLICDADCIADAGYHSADAARRTARARKDFLKAQNTARKAHATLTAKELSELYYTGETSAPAEPNPAPKVRRMITAGNLAVRQDIDAVADNDEDYETSFSAALNRIAGSASVIQFPQGNEPISNEYGSQKKGG